MPNSQKVIQRNLKWFALGLILSTPFTFPMIAVGPQLSEIYGSTSAACAIVIGNLFLWGISFAVISMASENASNALENIRSYLGKYGAILIWIIFMIAILNWFVQQLDGVMSSVTSVFGIKKESTVLRVGTGLGLITTFLSLGGIRTLKWITYAVFPFILGYHLLCFFHSNQLINSAESINVPAPAIISVVYVFLAGAMNSPTLFRHARSKEDALPPIAIRALKHEKLIG